MKIELDPGARQALSHALTKYLDKEFGLDIGGLEAVQLLDFITERLGPRIYNQALQDAQTQLSAKLEALSEALYDLEKPVKT
jgi:uncharacterized protein (DUF2164 family)